MPTIWIPAPWRAKLTDGQQQVDVEAETLRQAVEALDGRNRCPYTYEGWKPAVGA